MLVAGEPQLSYFKRFRMEIDLQPPLPLPELPPGYSFVAWHDSLLEAHADTKYLCFLDEIDALVFPSLGCRDGCFRLMSEISRKPGFHPEATWLLAAATGYCGTVQGVRERGGSGAIQNLGITAAHRSHGLGQALLLQALHGFRRRGLHRALLEVTAHNDAAVRLYRRVGFRSRKTIYKTVNASHSLTASSPARDSARAWWI